MLKNEALIIIHIKLLFIRPAHTIVERWQEVRYFRRVGEEGDYPQFTNSFGLGLEHKIISLIKYLFTIEVLTEV